MLKLWRNCVFALRPRDRSHAHRCRTCPTQHLAARPRRRSSRVNVVDEQNIPPRNQLWLRCKKNAAQVGATLVRTQARLAKGRFSPFERASINGELPFRPPSPQLAHRRLRQQLRMVKSALFPLRRIQRHRNNEQFAPRRTRRRANTALKLQNRLGQQPAQPFRNRQNPVILQSMDQRPQCPGVTPISDRAFKRWRRQPAGLAETVGRPRFQTADMGKRRHLQVFAASRTDQSHLRGNPVPAIVTNGGAAEPQKRVAANTAGGREQHGTYIVDWTSKSVRKGGRPTSQVAYHSAPCRGLG